MIDRIFLNTIATFSKITSAIIICFAYFVIFSIIEVDKNPVTIAGILFISYLVVDAFIRLSGKAYENSIMDEVEDLIKAAVMSDKEKKQYINKNVKSKYTLQLELNILLIVFSTIVMLMSTMFSRYFEYGWELQILYSRELLSTFFLAVSMSAILFLLIKMIFSFRKSKGFSLLRSLSVNAFVLYILLVFYVFSFIDALFVLFL